MNYFYNPELEQNSKKFSFNPEESRHIAKVLRKKEGDEILVTRRGAMRVMKETGG